jgi:hypothetical protein
MKGITFWGIFAAVQLVGLLVAIPGGPHTGFGYWVVSGVLVFGEIADRARAAWEMTEALASNERSR